MRTAPRYLPHYTIDDYKHWKGHWELWNGVAVSMLPTPGGGHAKVLARLIRAIACAVDTANCNATVLVGIDWIVCQDTIVCPDVTVVSGPEPEGHVIHPPAMIVEVLADASRQRDTVFKQALYESQGVATYLIADPAARSVHALSLSSAGRYASASCNANAQPLTIELHQCCHIVLDPASLFL
jgi:Uma2 family endonuclease